MNDVIDRIRPLGYGIASAAVGAVILNQTFKLLQPWRPEEGEFGYNLWFLMVDATATALGWVTPGVASAALVVLALLGYNWLRDPW